MITLTLNGQKVEVDPSPGESLLALLRQRLGLTGSKLACGRGECGACTVLVDGRPVMSCIMLAEVVDGRSVTTIEGLSESHRVLRMAFADHGGFQCGFCTPGQIVRASALLDGVHKLNDVELRHEMAGNICRCTGYDQIIDAIRAAHRPNADGVPAREA